ncbi:MAG: Protein-ADP-ribose hydrolase [Burkholderia gladioli]|nr:MAG: Protein-ADP-ribose hydrolase [Burkholderia gladioli]
MAGRDVGPAEQLAACYRRSLEVAVATGCASLAFPAISCGVYRIPPGAAAAIAVSTVVSMLPGAGFTRIVFACFGEDMLDHYTAELARL